MNNNTVELIGKSMLFGLTVFNILFILILLVISI